LSTQYRTPIDFSEEAVTATLKGMHNIYRTLDRTERLAGQSVYASGQDAAIIDPASGDAAKVLSETITRCEKKFFDCLEDDFNTAGALSELSVLSNAVNRFIEVENLETAGCDDAFINATNGAQQIAILGQVLGLFTKSLEAAAGGGDIDNVIGLLVDIRKTAKETKNFSLSDAIRDGVISAGVTLEDRPDKTTGWQVNSRDGTLNTLMTLVISLRQGVKDAKDFVMSDAIRDKGGAIGIVFEDRPDGTTGWRKQ
jgi:cysteinyl-tRNA synthetase